MLFLCNVEPIGVMNVSPERGLGLGDNCMGLRTLRFGIDISTKLLRVFSVWCGAGAVLCFGERIRRKFTDTNVLGVQLFIFRYEMAGI